MQTTHGTALVVPSAEQDSLRGVLRAYPVLGWRSHIGLVVVALGLLGVDWATKQWALHYLGSGQTIRLVGDWVQLKLMLNPGAAFSMGEGMTVAFACLGIVAIIAVAGFVAPRAKGRLANIVVGLLLAGIAGNLADRLFRQPGAFEGMVVDWISLRFFVCNVADICITATAVAMIIWLLRASARRA